MLSLLSDIYPETVWYLSPIGFMWSLVSDISPATVQYLSHLVSFYLYSLIFIPKLSSFGFMWSLALIFLLQPSGICFLFVSCDLFSATVWYLSRLVSCNLYSLIFLLQPSGICLLFVSYDLFLIFPLQPSVICLVLVLFDLWYWCLEFTWFIPDPVKWDF